MDNENLENVGNNAVDTTATETPENGTQGTESTPTEPAKEEVPPTTFTQEQLNDTIRKRLDEQSKRLCKKYGIVDENGLDEMANKAKSYDELKASYDILAEEVKGLKEQAVLSKNNILADKQDDVRTYFKGKGMDISDESLKELLQTHPEWQPQSVKTTTIVPLGGDRTEPRKETDEDVALKMFGFDKFVR